MIVYLITNTINGKRYIGQTIRTLEWRWKYHQKNRSGCVALLNAIKKYGADNFIIEPLIEVSSVALMNEFEAEYIKRYNTLSPNGYNLTTGGSSPRHNEETRKKISLSHIGRPIHENTRKALASANKGNSWNKGKKRPIEVNLKVSQANLGRKHSAESIAKMRLVQSNAPWKSRKPNATVS